MPLQRSPRHLSALQKQWRNPANAFVMLWCLCGEISEQRQSHS
jgi:hypothetical protein